MTDPEHRAHRLAEFARLSTRLAAIEDDELRLSIGDDARARGWGLSGPAEICGSSVFVKRIPLTDTEMEHQFSTRNHYGIPTYYNYGVGSAGFGAFRELAAHVKTTNWAVQGDADGFPLMYHFRLLNAPEGSAGPVDADRLREYVRHWNGNEGIERYMLDRSSAVNELVIVLECVSHTMTDWLPHNLWRADDVVEQLVKTISCLRGHGVVHFDAHFANVVTDGQRHLLTDFGLALDSEFELAPDERAFLRRHMDYDYGEALLSVGSALMWVVQGLPEPDRGSIRRALGIEEDVLWYSTGSTLISRVEDLAGMTSIDPAYVATVKRYRPVMLFMGDFLRTLRANPRKDTPFDDEMLRDVLRDAGVPV